MKKSICAAAVAVALAYAGYASDAEAKCFKKTASGTSTSIDGAKFQVKEAILQSFDWGVWASFMASGSTPGYKVSSPAYRCSPAVSATTVSATSTICKTG
ncbi:MAG: hypothetical protein WDN31_09635 [Hyphomicrobium sp.]